jgi:hypothetical protein
MKSKCNINGRWLIKAALCLVFISFMTAKSQAQLGGPPVIAVQPLGLSVQDGGTAIITATATSLTKMQLYWFCNGQPVSATNCAVLNVYVPLVGTVSTLTIKNTAANNAGTYSLRVTNAVGSAVSSGATLIVLTSTISNTLSNVVSFVSTETHMVTGGFKLQLSGPVGSNVVVEASSDLKNWTPVYTNQVTTGSITYTDAVANTLPARYYRAKIQ